MAVSSVRFIVTSLGGLEGRLREQAERMRNLQPAMQKVLLLMRNHVRREFSRETWESPSGSRPWKPRKPFGTRQPSNPPLGPVLAAWMAGGKATARQAEIGAAGKAAEISAFHRGGTGGGIPLGTNASVRWRAKNKVSGASRLGANNPGQWKMYWFLRSEFGVHATNERLTKGFVVPLRRFGTRNPRLSDAQAQVIGNFIRTGKPVLDASLGGSDA